MSRSNLPRIELIYDADCPNINRARAMIEAALIELGAALVWTEWDREAANIPQEYKRFGSPTVLVNGQDVGCDEMESALPIAKSCRVYVEGECMCGAPSARLIVTAINGAMKQ